MLAGWLEHLKEGHARSAWRWKPPLVCRTLAPDEPLCDISWHGRYHVYTSEGFCFARTKYHVIACLLRLGHGRPLVVRVGQMMFTQTLVLT